MSEHLKNSSDSEGDIDLFVRMQFYTSKINRDWLLAMSKEYEDGHSGYLNEMLERERTCRVDEIQRKNIEKSIATIPSEDDKEWEIGIIPEGIDEYSSIYLKKITPRKFTRFDLREKPRRKNKLIPGEKELLKRYGYQSSSRVDGFAIYHVKEAPRTCFPIQRDGRLLIPLYLTKEQHKLLLARIFEEIYGKKYQTAVFKSLTSDKLFELIDVLSIDPEEVPESFQDWCYVVIKHHNHERDQTSRFRCVLGDFHNPRAFEGYESAKCWIEKHKQEKCLPEQPVLTSYFVVPNQSVNLGRFLLLP